MPALKVLSALDVARIQWYHFKAIIVAGMGLFTDAYDLFCIAPIMKMIGHIYYHKDSIGTAVLSTSYAIALLGTALGQLIFGYLGDRVGRRRVYGLCLMIMVLSSFGCGFSVCTTRRSCVIATLVEKNAFQAEKDMQKVMSVCKVSQVEDLPEEPPSSSSSSYKLFSRRFFSLHGRDLFAASANWFLVDVVFYTSNLLLSQIVNLSDKPASISNVYDSAFEAAKVAAIVAACSTIPGYWFTVYFIDRVGRVKIQIMGFFFMAVVYLAAGIPYSWYRSDHGYTSNKCFVVLYGLIFFFSNFGPNTTTFIIPAELFPARFRSTCHGISGAAGKLGAIVGTVGFLWGTKRDEEHKDVFPDVKRVRIAFLILGGVCIAGVLVTYFCTRETMGRSLEENEEDEIITRMSSADELLPRRQ
ncbi:hypothetical protein F2Q70_00045540 [Brassica cretica]|uniref:Major facilitator superfamily (MFS) profile domain-containing protein n=1 Tax=Brassica cretica TaxID=69181 RepID=A0A8S9KGF6_BRACR|nr:hypothetical protein F2Q70_00045540 [Brassica cretica]